MRFYCKWYILFFPALLQKRLRKERKVRKRLQEQVGGDATAEHPLSAHCLPGQPSRQEQQPQQQQQQQQQQLEQHQRAVNNGEELFCDLKHCKALGQVYFLVEFHWLLESIHILLVDNYYLSSTK